MEMYFSIWMETIMWVGLFSLSIIVTIVFTAKIFPFVKRAFAKFSGLGKLEQTYAVFAVVILTIYAGTKPSSTRITFESGLKDDGSFVTNDTVHIEWVKSGTPYVPDSAKVYIDFRPIAERNGDAELGNTDDVWRLLGETTAGAYEFNTTLPNATNYDYNVWYYYVTSESVHTNGVWMYKTMPSRKQTPDTMKAIPLRAVTKGDCRVIATPSAKRKEENNQ